MTFKLQVILSVTIMVTSLAFQSHWQGTGFFLFVSLGCFEPINFQPVSSLLWATSYETFLKNAFINAQRTDFM